VFTPWCNDIITDASPSLLKALVAGYYMCSAQPATYAQATATYSLGGIALDLSGVPIQNGDIDGRKITIPGRTITATGAGGVGCLALVSADTLLYVDPLDELLVVELDYDAQLPAWDIEWGGPKVIEVS
jgi:hypothetical protein